MPRYKASETELCGAEHPMDTDDPESPMLRCDRGASHIGRHAERWVASWARSGGDVRWNTADAATALYPRYDSPVP